ncbi:MAG: hypothetical protein M1457_07580 [bacterium]|nr:hypothetical protein [bacterium]
MGRPAAGRILTHPLDTFPFAEGAELTRRLEGIFGDLTRLTCMDLGCGPADTVIARQVLEIPWRRLISVEAFIPYVYRLREKTVRAAHHDIREVRIESIFSTFVAREADLALMIDVLEHFPRREALRLLVQLETFVSRGIVLFVPIGDVPQDDLDQNALQRHRSRWQPEELARLGYEVEVYEGFHGQLTPPATAAWAIKRLGK